jgi:hypothetical protein
MTRKFVKRSKFFALRKKNLFRPAQSFRNEGLASFAGARGDEDLSGNCMSTCRCISIVVNVFFIFLVGVSTST